MISVRRRGFSTIRTPNAATVQLEGRAASVSDPSGGPAYTPFAAISFDEGTNGGAPPSLTAEGATQVSTDIAGPFGETRTVKSITGGLGGQFYGAERVDTAFFTVTAGDSLWLAMWYFIPTDFCAGFGTTSGDGYGLTKWLRLERLTSSNGSDTLNRITIQAQNFTSQSCSTTGPAFWGCSCEGFAGGGGELSGFHYYEPDYGATAPVGRRMVRGQWQQHQYKFLFGTSAASSRLEMWSHGTYLGQCTSDAAFLTSSTNHFRLIIGDYWNGGPPNANRPQSFYFSNLIMTKATPNTVDSGGRPFIALSTQARDFA